MVSLKRKSDSDDEDRVDIRGFGIHSLVEGKRDNSKLGMHLVGEGIEEIIAVQKSKFVRDMDSFLVGSKESPYFCTLIQSERGHCGI